MYESKKKASRVVGMLNKKVVVSILSFFCALELSAVNSFQFDSRYSTLKILSGATFQVDQPLVNFGGTLNIASGGSVTGQLISFVDGILQNNLTQQYLSAIFNPPGTIKLTGGHTFNALPGQVINSITVSGKNNLLTGQPVFASSVTLADANTTLTIAIQSQMNQNIVLNGGTLVLGNDLVFSDGNMVQGNGTIVGNGYAFATGNAPFTWTGNINWFTTLVLNANTTIVGTQNFNSATNEIRGNGFVLDLTGGGVISVGAGATLTIANTVVKGIGNSAGCGKIVLTNNTSK